MTKPTRIVFIGAPGCGKSTLAAEVFVALKKLGKNTELVMEWIRRDIMKHGAPTSILEQYRTLTRIRHEEEHFPDQVEYIIQDGGTLLGYFYAAVYSTKNDPKERLVIQDMYEVLLNDLYSRKYDHIYFLPREQVITTGISVDDGTRFQTPQEFAVLENYMRLIFTEIHKMDNINVLDCSLEDRVSCVLKDICNDILMETLIPDIKLSTLTGRLAYPGGCYHCVSGTKHCICPGQSPATISDMYGEIK